MWALLIIIEQRASREAYEWEYVIGMCDIFIIIIIIVDLSREVYS